MSSKPKIGYYRRVTSIDSAKRPMQKEEKLQSLPERLPMSRIVLPQKTKEEKPGKTIRLPEATWAKIKAIAEASSEANAENWSVNDVIEYFVNWALESYEPEKRGGKK